LGASNGGEGMTDYFWGILVGVMAGYCLSLLTLVMMWALCVIAKEQNNEGDTDEETGN
jgi:hypothetical protein